MGHIPSLPIELWRHIVALCKDWPSLLNLAATSHQMRAIVLGGRWSGIASLRLALEPLEGRGDRIVDLDTETKATPDGVVASLLPRCRHLTSLSLSLKLHEPGTPPHTASVPTGTPPASPSTTSLSPSLKGTAGPPVNRLLRSLAFSSWLRGAGALTRLELQELYAVSPQAPPLVMALAPQLRELVLQSCRERGPVDASRLWKAVAVCKRLRALHFGFCKDRNEQTPSGLVSAGLAGKTELEELSLRGLSFLGPHRLLDTFAVINAPKLKSLCLESMGYTNDMFQAASVAGVEKKAHFASIRTFTINKCGYIFAPLLLSVMTKLERLHVALGEMSEVTKLALSFLLEYAGAEDKPRHILVLQNDLTAVQPTASRPMVAVSSLLDACRQAIMAIRKKFHLHFDLSLVELPHPQPEQENGVQAMRFCLTKGRAMVYLDTLFHANLSLLVPNTPKPPLAACS